MYTYRVFPSKDFKDTEPIRENTKPNFTNYRSKYRYRILYQSANSMKQSFVLCKRHQLPVHGVHINSLSKYRFWKYLLIKNLALFIATLLICMSYCLHSSMFTNQNTDIILLTFSFDLNVSQWSSNRKFLPLSEHPLPTTWPSSNENLV